MNQTKRFLDIVTEIRDMTHRQNIQPGDRLPSERELAETLQVGRSTIREALRSLELLGLIETRRGEGTFLSDFRNHKLVEVLATFILQDRQSNEDVQKTRLIHELAAIDCVCREHAAAAQPVWDGFLEKLQENRPMSRESIVREILVLSGNRLSLKIWLLLLQYGGRPFDGQVTEDETEVLAEMIRAISAGDSQLASKHYISWCEQIEGGNDHDHS
ncbi:FadR/GntR family transcriptional regulator [Indiicoccus explosivorum]|uniref:FadR/GntR family transcriptional regulator n=1 Tax=Indiicoccus explosivorum TaxID=1917864 RepID=UPI000B44F5C9|nr:GntR family transcriptional regulator [Indiicoccus explosivorum]